MAEVAGMKLAHESFFRHLSTDSYYSEVAHLLAAAAHQSILDHQTQTRVPPEGDRPSHARMAPGDVFLRVAHREDHVLVLHPGEATSHDRLVALPHLGEIKVQSLENQGALLRAHLVGVGVAALLRALRLVSRTTAKGHLNFVVMRLHTVATVARLLHVVVV
jgi:hypothetical protein